MNRAAEALRMEIKRRWDAREVRQLAIFQAWIKASEFLEIVPYSDGPVYDLEILAKALRAHNMRAHPDPGWEGTTEQARELWREKARWIADAIERNS